MTILRYLNTFLCLSFVSIKIYLLLTTGLLDCHWNHALVMYIQIEFVSKNGFGQPFLVFWHSGVSIENTKYKNQSRSKTIKMSC